MPQIREQAAERMRRDHESLLEMVQRIKSLCSQGQQVDNCNKCPPNPRMVCQGNIEQLIRTFVETTLKHNMIESLYMEDGVPMTHRIAHNQAHLAMAEQMKSIRVVLSEDRNCVLAIEGIDRVLEALKKHFEEFDKPLEHYLLAPA
jgi:hemerythrin